MTTLADTFDAKRNSFNFVRLLAATVVLFSHSYPLTGSTYEPFAARLGGYDTGGGWAVAAFFVISGFLITRSAERRDWEGYVAGRILRIVPALAVVILLQTLVLGPLLTTLSLSDYLAGAKASLWGIFVFPVTAGLPGVFADLPVSVVNGSLWTLPVEAGFYVVTALLMAFGALRPIGSLVVGLGFVGAYLWLHWTGHNWGNQGGNLFTGVPLYSGVKLGALFYLGAALWTWRHRVPISPALAALCLVLLWMSKDGLLKPLVYCFAYAYLVIFICQLKLFDLSGLMGRTDISYGVYLYAFPIQQLVVLHLGAGISPHLVTALALPLTAVCALLSWRYVEEPFLRLKPVTTRRPVRQTGRINESVDPAG